MSEKNNILDNDGFLGKGWNFPLTSKFSSNMSEKSFFESMEIPRFLSSFLKNLFYGILFL